jgi:transmembrane sensor
MMTKEEFILLLEKYTSGTISPGEHSELFTAISSGHYDDLVSQHIGNNLLNDDTEGANLPPHRSAEILHKVLSSEKQNSLLLPRVSKKPRIIRWMAIAAVTVTIIFSVYLLTGRSHSPAVSPISFSKDMEEKSNTSAQPQKMQMEDGSIITLQPGSVIHYPLHFLPGKREVFLEGEAFFEVSKNPNRPFFVYNKNIVTHVLGTSFNVQVNNETHQVEVSVRSGRVEVYENNTAGKNEVAHKNNGVILLPNQKVIYNEVARQFVPSLVDKPLPIINELNDKEPVVENIVFDETPLKTVLPYLEKNYGIEIVVENEDLYKCLFTGDVSRQELYTRLDVICQAVNASYEVKGTKILIKGKGCN